MALHICVIHVSNCQQDLNHDYRIAQVASFDYTICK